MAISWNECCSIKDVERTIAALQQELLDREKEMERKEGMVRAIAPALCIALINAIMCVRG